MRGDLTDDEWGGALAACCRLNVAAGCDLRRIIVCVSTECLMSYELVVRGGTCMSVIENGIRSMCGSVDGQSRVLGTPSWLQSDGGESF